MNWQEIVSLGIVAVTALLLIRSQIAKRNRPGCCGEDCGCTTPSTSAKSVPFDV